MSAYSSLESIIRDILAVLNPSHDDWSVRYCIIQELRAVVRSLAILRGATVEPYGSFASNLFTRWGDLDVSVDINNRSHISSTGKKQKQALLRYLLGALRRKGGCRNLEYVGSARVPILKFESKIHNVSCDISINNLNGQIKSKLLLCINEIDGRFRDMVLLVKEWAKTHVINDSKSGTFNSYCLCMLVIFHFQTCVPAILPPLKDIYPGNMVDDLSGVRTVAEKQILEICSANIHRIKADRFRAINRSPLSELFISFLRKFCNISLKATVQRINPYSGQWENIATNTTRQPKTYALFVEDPFERPENVARTVSHGQLAKISEAFQTSYNILAFDIIDRANLVSTLIRPKISQFLTVAPTESPSYNSITYNRSHQAVPSSSNNSQEFPSLRSNSSQEFPSLREILPEPQASSSRGHQHMW